MRLRAPVRQPVWRPALQIHPSRDGNSGEGLLRDLARVELFRNLKSPAILATEGGAAEAPHVGKPCPCKAIDSHGLRLSRDSLVAGLPANRPRSKI